MEGNDPLSTRVGVLDRDVRELRLSIETLSTRLDRVGEQVSDMARADEIAAAVVEATKRERAYILGWPARAIVVVTAVSSVLALVFQLRGLA